MDIRVVLVKNCIAIIHLMETNIQILLVAHIVGELELVGHVA